MNIHRGSSFDVFLEEEGILEEVSAKAHKSLISLQLTDIMKKSKITKMGLAKKMQISRSQLDRLLDPENTTISSGDGREFFPNDCKVLLESYEGCRFTLICFDLNTKN